MRPRGLTNRVICAACAACASGPPVDERRSHLGVLLDGSEVALMQPPAGRTDDDRARAEALLAEGLRLRDAGDLASSQTALLSEIVPPEQRTQVLSGYRFSADLGAFVGPVLLAAVMDAASAQVAILVAAGILISASLVARFAVPASVE